MAFWSDNLLSSWSLINLDFLLLHTAHSDRNIVPPSAVFETLGFLLSVSVFPYKQYNNSAF